MKKCFISIVLFFSMSSFAFCVDKAVEQKVNEAMQRNFDACNKEDVRAVMNSCSNEMPDRDKFEKESVSVFAEKDIHYSLVECELIEIKFPYALARIVQDTYVQNRDAPTKPQKAYRNSSALLPDERVEYLNTFKFENGVWKLLVIVSEMKQVNVDKAEAE